MAWQSPCQARRGRSLGRDALGGQRLLEPAQVIPARAISLVGRGRP